MCSLFCLSKQILEINYREIIILKFVMSYKCQKYMFSATVFGISNIVLYLGILHDLLFPRFCFPQHILQSCV